jgi:hypothetical protein
MVNDTPTEDAGVRPVSTEVTSRPGQPTEQLEIENSVPEVEINYPTGPKLWLTVATLSITMFLKGLVRS